MSLLGDASDLLDGDLEDVELIGRGATGEVYRGKERRLGRDVAVKVIRHGPPSAARGGPTSEASAQARVSWHANVLTVYDEGELTDGSPFLVLEFAPGGSLIDRLMREGPLPSAELIRLGRELASALTAAHNAGLVHCDVKPANVLFAADGSARLADFGIARSVDLTTRTLDSLGGSLAYVPPELLDGDPPRPSNDVYALALTLWTAATGRVPFGAESLTPAAVIAAIRSTRLSFSDIRPFPPPLQRLLSEAVLLDPEKRPAAGTLFEGFSAQERLPTFVLPGPLPQARNRWGRWLRYGALLSVGAIATGVLVDAPHGGVAEPSAASTPRAGLCPAYQSFIDDREVLFRNVSTDAEMGTSAVGVIERLMVEYPRLYGDVTLPFLDVARSYEPSLPQVSRAQIAQLAMASILNALAGGKSLVFDGEAGELNPASLPWQLRLPTSALSQAISYADSSCEAASDLAPAKARMRSAIRSNLLDGEFMRDFFQDPRSFDLMTPDLVMLMVAIARGPLEVMLDGHWTWFIELCEKKPDIRQSLATEYPDTFLLALSQSPEMIDRFTPEWREEIWAGIRAVGDAERLGIYLTYGSQLDVLGLGSAT